jgi:hypothetical protein
MSLMCRFFSGLFLFLSLMSFRYLLPSAFCLSSVVESMWVGFFGFCGAGVTGARVTTVAVVMEISSVLT